VSSASQLVVLSVLYHCSARESVVCEGECCLLVLNSVVSTPQWIHQPVPRDVDFFITALSEESSSDSGGGGSRRAQSSVVCGWSRGTNSFIHDFMCFLGGRVEGFLIVRLHAGCR
jgi:hypothetical protein